MRVPVATSALIQVPWVQATLPPGQRVGIITVSKSSLTPRHLEAAGVKLDTPMVGTEDGDEFFRVLIRAEKQDMDVALAAQDIIAAGRKLVAEHPDVGAIVLECTNMPPYAHALRESWPAGLRYLLADHLAACRAAATRFRATGRPDHLPRLRDDRMPDISRPRALPERNSSAD